MREKQNKMLMYLFICQVSCTSGLNIFPYLFYIQARLCTGFQELNSIINSQLREIKG